MGFIQEFGPELKDNIMRFTSEFHRNGRLSKGSNNTFIALILKCLNEFCPIALWGVCIKF